MSPGSTSRPLTPSSTRSGIPPTRVPTTGRARQNASTMTRPIPSERDGSTSTVDSSSAARDLRLRETRVPHDPPARLTRRAARRPAATCRSRRAEAAPRGRRAATRRPRLRQPVHVLVALEDADEERLRLLRQRSRRLLQERVEVHVGRKLVRRLEAELAHDARRVARHRANRVRVPQPRNAPPDRRPD